MTHTCEYPVGRPGDDERCERVARLKIHIGTTFIPPPARSDDMWLCADHYDQYITDSERGRRDWEDIRATHL